MFRKYKTFNGNIFTGKQELKTPRGDFNKDYFLYAQILDAPNPSDDVTTLVEGLSPAQELGAFTKTSEKKPSQEAVWDNVVSSQNLLWSPRDMHGIEYEDGAFQASVAHFAREGKLVATQITTSVATRQLPSLPDMVHEGVKSSTIDRDLKSEYNIHLEETSQTQVYIIAPQKNMAAAQEMIHHFANRSVEAPSHRGFGFNKAAIYQTLSEHDQKQISRKEAYTAPKAWFDVENGIFFTLDKNMYENAKIAFDATNYEPSRFKRFKKALGL